MKPVDLYIFSIFIFVLLCALLFIYVVVYRRFVAQPKGKKALLMNEEASEAAREREDRLFKLYQNMEEMMDSFEAYVEDTRGQMESVKRQMQQQSDGLGEMLRRVEAAEAGARAALAALRAVEKPEPRKEPAPAPAEPPAAEALKRNAPHNEIVKELLSRGMTVEQIAQKLEISINEVRLIVYGLVSRNAEHK